jgi:hypothetical protein
MSIDAMALCDECGKKILEGDTYCLDCYQKAITQNPPANVYVSAEFPPKGEDVSMCKDALIPNSHPPTPTVTREQIVRWAWSQNWDNCLPDKAAQMLERFLVDLNITVEEEKA